MKREFKVVSYKTEREVQLRLNRPVHVRLLSIRGTNPDKVETISVEDFDNNDEQPAFLKVDTTLLSLLEGLYGKKYLRRDLEITRLPKVQGGKPNNYKIAEIKIK